MLSPEDDGIRLTSLGNAGILIRTDSLTIAVDPYFPEERSGVDVSTEILWNAPSVDWFLISHDHWDHFDPEMIAALSRRHGARIAGPGPVAARLLAQDPDLPVCLMDPGPLSASCPPPSLSLDLLGPCPMGPSRPPLSASDSSGPKDERNATLTVFKTPHGRNHLSLLISLPEARLYFDCDNHNTGILPLEVLKPVDCLFLYPWRRSGWRDFLSRLDPAFWFLVHLSDNEMEDYRRGICLPCFEGPPPRTPVVLDPGETWP